MDPANGAIKQHYSDSRSEQLEDPSGFRPFGSKHQAHHILADQSKIGPHRHTNKCNDPKRIGKVSPEANGVLIQPAQRRQGDIEERRSKLAGRKREQVVSFLVESKSRGIELPANQKIVEISRKIVRAEPAIDLCGES